MNQFICFPQWKSHKNILSGGILQLIVDINPYFTKYDFTPVLIVLVVIVLCGFW